MEKNTWGMTARKTSYSTRKVTVIAKNTGRKVGFAAVFADITIRGALPDEAFIHTAEMTTIKIAMREIEKREDMTCIIYTDLPSSMLAMENNRENYPISNQIYDILTELYNQGKQITLCIVSAHI